MMLLSFQSSSSLFEGIYSPERIYNIALKLGYSSVLIADTENLYNLAEIVRLREERQMNIYSGVRIRYLSKTPYSPIIAIPINERGLSNLLSLISAFKIDQNLRDERFIKFLKERTDGLILLCSDIHTIRVLKNLSSNLFFGINHKNITLYPILRSEGIKPILFQNAIFASEDDIKIGIVLRCISNKKRYDEMIRLYESFKEYIPLPAQTIKKQISHIKDAFENLDYLESLLETKIIKPTKILPGSDIEDASTHLYELAYKGAKERYGNNMDDKILSRLNYELNIIAQKGYSGYFLIVKDIVDQTELTCGRGSGAASLVAYCLGITNVDPIKHNLMFERFLNPERSDPPDIDVDFAWDEREKIFDYIFNRFKNRVAQVSNHNRFSDRLAIREVARTFGFSERDINRIVNTSASIMNYQNFYTHYLKRDSTGSDELQNDNIIKEIFQIASKISPDMRHISTHCGGIVISSNDITDSIPVEITGGGRFVSQWDKDDLEEFSIVKIDILGNRSLAVIRDAIKMIQKNYGIDIKKKRIIFEEDPLTLELIKEGKTIGVFYIESPAMRQLQQKADVADFEHIVIHSSIIRPAANKYINEYVERLKGKPYKPLHPALTDLLSETYGIMCYQEDVMKAAISIAGFTYEEADRLRKTLSKKNRAEKLQYYKEKFFEGARKNGNDESVIREIWEMIESFGGYSFCKPHSASYAQVSFMSAYIKAHFPAEFIASVIGNKGGYYSVFAYISEGRRMGLKVNPPDINISEARAIAVGDSIWLGFEDIVGLKHNAIDKIITERERYGNYNSFADFIKRNSELDFEDIRLIILSGAFDKIEGIKNRPTLLLRAELFKKGKIGVLFPHTLNDEIQLPPISFERQIEIEIEISGFPLSIHPIKLVGPIPQTPKTIRASEIKENVGKNIEISGLLITAKPIITRTDEVMEFLTFEDETEIFEVVIFPDAYKKFGHLLNSGSCFMLSGKVENDHGAIYLNCHKIIPLNHKKNTKHLNNSSHKATIQCT